ncbi:hypothetical protein DDE83_008196 [Stemphylium lycopersici]|uniref:Uncharacterized protein n=1 Tax=Stemphylium lycopersici TaxID=183478 RepID=A0A364MUG3_STELY|nr:hypothetical protein DDE83_008196 [Stemphylium lycopersici]
MPLSVLCLKESYSANSMS